ncbi:hypothetical protein GJ496_009533 [Pomphorhynchus laevis]|nr:hypothetical protein GJ496_009533 [Pomphorhynchus laevis]
MITSKYCQRFSDAIPVMPIHVAAILCILNIILPGSGTLLSSVLVFGNRVKHHHKTNFVAFVYNLIAGLIQLATAIILLGWIWSIIWGLMFLRLAAKLDEYSDPHLCKVRK